MEGGVCQAEGVVPMVSAKGHFPQCQRGRCRAPEEAVSEMFLTKQQHDPSQTRGHVPGLRGGPLLGLLVRILQRNRIN